MTESEEISNKIKSIGEQIRVSKSEKKSKDEWGPLLDEMITLKKQYEQVTGETYGGGGGGDGDGDKKKADKGSANTEASDKNKEKRAKKAAEKAAKEAKKEANRRAREEREREKAAKIAGASKDKFGDLGMVNSSKVTDKEWTEISSLDLTSQDKNVLIRGNVATSRSVGKGVFLLVRSGMHSVQCVCFEDNKAGVSKEMVKFMVNLPIETVIDVQGVVTKPNEAITSATQSCVEIAITTCFVVCPSLSSLPFTLEDAARPETEEDDKTQSQATVNQELRLNYRWIDLRTPANNGIFKVQAAITRFFREFLHTRQFIEIRTPKIIPGASEGGSEVFKLNYFNQEACLSMSPQLHKQILAACSGFGRVYETGPVFRAEDSNTRRHLCEFTGLDLEMTIHEHYYEILDLFSDLFIYIFDNIAKELSQELKLISQQYPFQPLQYTNPTLKLTFAEGAALLKKHRNIHQDPFDDLSTENEKHLGNIVKELYNTDFFFMDKYPLAVRPFYTMPDPNNAKLSNSYDFFIRGQEILSGAQRIHDPTLLTQRAEAKDIPLDTLDFYIKSFQHGALPHGGGGIGLERVTMLYLGLNNIRKASFFPRDPKRLSP